MQPSQLLLSRLITGLLYASSFSVFFFFRKVWTLIDSSFYFILFFFFVSASVLISLTNL